MQNVSYYRWKRRFKEKDMEGLKNNKSNPEQCPHKPLDEEKKRL